ncbi:hypothetical protein ACHAWX_000151 [Stephanocyclus meneghinianus]
MKPIRKRRKIGEDSLLQRICAFTFIHFHSFYKATDRFSIMGNYCTESNYLGICTSERIGTC